MTNPLSPAFLISSLMTLTIGFWAFSFNLKNQMLCRWFLFCLSVALWSFGLGMLTSAPSLHVANTFYSVHYLGAIHIPFCFLLFVKSYFKKNSKLSLDLIICYSLVLLQLWLFFSGLLVAPLTPKWQFAFYTNPAKFYWFFMGYFSSYVVYSFILMASEFLKMKKPAEKRGALFFIIATALGYTGGSSAFLLVYNFDFPPYGIFLFLLFPILTTYAIVRHHLLDIEVIIKRTVVFAGLLAMAMGVVSLVTALSQIFLSRYFMMPPYVSTLLCVLLTLALMEPTKQFLLTATDKYLFQKQEALREVLNTLANRILTILDIDKVGRAVLDVLKDSLRLKSGAIIIKEEEKEGYHILDAFGLENSRMRFTPDDLFIQWFLKNKTILNLDDLESAAVDVPQVVLDKVRELHGVVLMPLYLQDDLIGILIFGQKKSDDVFHDKDVSYFPAVAAEVAIALSNAREINIRKKNQFSYAQQAKLAALGTMTAGVAHELNNPLNVARGCLEIFPLQMGFGVFDKMTKEQLLETFLESIQRAMEGLDRAARIVKRMSGFSKKKTQFDLEPIELKKAAETACDMVEHDFSRYDIELVRDYNPDLPRACADMDVTAQVLVNLLTNARDAIRMHPETVKKSVKVSTALHEREVEVSVADTGVGIPHDNLEKIFDPFFTTKDVSRNPDPEAVLGTGLGLHLVKQMVEEMGGRLQVESVISKGTVFRLFFPRIYESQGTIKRSA